jgi:hypothetical protein
MKATLEFNLPDDREDFELATNGYKYYGVLWEFDQHLRAKIKYDEKLSEEVHDTYQEIREKLREYMNDSNLSFN